MNRQEQKKALRDEGPQFAEWLNFILQPLATEQSSRITITSVIKQLGLGAGSATSIQVPSKIARPDAPLAVVEEIIEKLESVLQAHQLSELCRRWADRTASLTNNTLTVIGATINIGGTLDIGSIVCIVECHSTLHVERLMAITAQLISEAINSEKMSVGIEKLAQPFWKDEDAEVAAAKYTVVNLRETISCAAAVLWITDKNRKYISLIAADGNVKPGTEMSMAIGEGVAGKCFQRAVPFVIGDLQDDEDLATYDVKSVAHPKIVNGNEWRSGIFVPLDAGGEVLGVVAAYGTRINGFSSHEREVAIAFAQRFTSALVHARRRQELEEINRRLTIQAPAIEAGLMAIRTVHDINNLLFQAQSKINEVVSLNRHDIKSIQYIRATEAGQFVDRSARAFQRMVRSAGRPGNLILSKRDLRAFIQEIIEPFQSSESRRGITISVECQHDLILRFDAYQIEQAITNIVENAVTFLADDHKRGSKYVRISVADRGDAVEINIEDNGPGFQPGYETEIFHPFYTTRPHKGLGFGLWIAQNALAAHRGRIVASSDWGYWANFAIHLPKYG